MPQTEVMPETKQIGRLGDPCVMVIFGAAGDLTRRKLIPALYNLAQNQLLSREFAIVGVARNVMTTEEFRKKVSDDIKQFATGSLDPDLWEWFLRRLHYITGEFNDKELYPKIKDSLAAVDKEHATHGNYFFYLATAADFFAAIVENLAAAGLMQQDKQHWRRVIVEKPFGRDLDSARALNKQLLKVVDENQIYRIDHYLG
ncbi:MAG: glucose-6-phosphate 1-dehydrogenase, partial [Acidobacteriaceae bacterium]